MEQDIGSRTKRQRASRIRTDLGSTRLPVFMRSTQCHYIPISDVGTIPEGLSINCKFPLNRYEQAYNLDGKWFLTWDDTPVDIPEGVQVRRGIYI